MRGINVVLVGTAVMAGWIGSAGLKASLGGTQSATRGSATISGTVMDAATLLPIHGAVVGLGRPGRHDASQISDERGRFVFPSLPAGSYLVSATRGGYADGDFGGLLHGAGARIVIHDSEWFSSANVRMTRLATISGTVTDEAGEPAVGVYVRALARVEVNGRSRFASGPATMTDDRGDYRLTSLLPRVYIVSVPFVQHSQPMSTASEGPATPASNRDDSAGVLPPSLAGSASPPAVGALVDGVTATVIGNYLLPPPRTDGRRLRYQTAFFPGAPDISGAIPIDLSRGGEQSGVNFTLEPVPSVAVSGRLEGLLSHERLLLRLVRNGMEDLGAGSETATTVPDSSGAFVFPNVPPGSYTLEAPGSTFEFSLRSAGVEASMLALPSEAGRPGLGVSRALIASAPDVTFSSRLPPGLSSTMAGFGRTSVSVGEKDVKNLLLALQRPGTVRGLIVYENPTVRPAGGSLEFASALGDPEIGVRRVPIYDLPRDRPDFVIPAVRPGDYALRTVALPGLTIKSVYVNGEDRTRRSITVKTGQTTDVVLTLTSRSIVVSGLIRDDRGTAVPLASVVAVPTDRALWTDYGFTPTWIRSSTWSSDGSYEITGIRAGDYFLVAVENSKFYAWSNPAFLAAAVAHAEHVSLDWGDTKTIDVRLVGIR